MNLVAYVLRGISGSGKSTLAKILAGKEGSIHSPDTYRYKDGVYCFNPAESFEIYEKNFLAFSQSITDKVPVVVCDKTNQTRADVDRYVEAAQKGGYLVSVVSLPHPDPVLASKRNEHFVPLVVIQKLIENWEQY